MQFDGSDKHAELTITDEGGVVLHRTTKIYKDETLYRRETGDDPNVYGEWRIVGTGLSGRPTLPCLSPPSNAERSAETPDFVEHTFLSDQEGSVQDEYWVDALGRPTRSRQTFYPPGADQSGGAATRSTHSVIEATFSGFGEENVITAPIATPAPTPAATTTIPGCPAGVQCYPLHEWPTFTAVYTATSNTSIHHGGTTYRPQETHQLEWRAVDDWKSTVIDAEQLDLEFAIYDKTGSWRQQKGRTYTVYDSTTDRTRTEQLPENEYMSPTGGFGLIGLSRHELAERIDGELVRVQADVCQGDDCHQVNEVSRTAASQGTYGRRFSDPEIAHQVFTDDEWRIPLESGSFDVQQLQIQPTEPDPIACQTNLREVIVSASLEDQQWDSNCTSTHRTGGVRTLLHVRPRRGADGQHRGGLADRRPVPLSALRRGQDRERHRRERRPQPHPIARFRP